MLKTMKKISSHPTCNRNVLEKFIGVAAFGTNRVLATSDNYHVSIEKSNEMTYFWEDYTKKISFKRRCINKVCTVLDYNEKKATELVEEHPILFLEDLDNTYENINLLTENSFTTDIIKQNIWLLYFNYDELQARISSIQLWNDEGYEVKDFLALFKLSPLDFQRVSDTFIAEKNKIPHGNRIVHLANILQVPVPLLTTRLVRHKYTLWRNLDLILESIKCYFEFGISGQDLMDDIWALRYSEPVIRRRLRIAKENNLPQMKAWYVRCSEEKFERTLELFKQEKTILYPFETREEYLANKLKIDLSVIKTVVRRNDIFHKINMGKLAEMIDYLLNVGFKTTDICSCGRIFYFSLETVMERISELKGLGVESLSLAMLITDENKYRKLVQRIEYTNSLRRNAT